MGERAGAAITGSAERERGIFWALLGLVAILYLLLMNGNLSPFVDNARYLAAAKSLVSGQGYNHIHSMKVTPQTLYPPGYPLLLAGLMAVFSFNLVVFKLSSVLATVGALAALFFLLRRHTDFASAAVVTLLAGASPLLARFAVAELTEAPYLLMSVLTLLLIEQSAGQVATNRYLPAAILAGAVAYYIKSAGIVLLPVALIFYGRGKEYRKAAIFGSAFLALISPWLIRGLTADVSANGTYFKQMLWKDPYNTALGRAGALDFLARSVFNLTKYAARGFGALPLAGSFASGRPLVVFLAAAGLCLSLLVLAGLFSGLRDRSSIIGVYLACYAGLYLLWPMVDTRFVHPVVPFVIFYCLSGAKMVNGKVGSRFPASMVAAVLVCVSLIGDGGLLAANARNRGLEPPQAHLYGAAGWLALHSPKDSFILSVRPEVMFLLSGRKAETYQNDEIFDDTKGYEARILSEGFDYVVLDAFRGQEETKGPLTKALIGNPRRFKLVHSSPRPVVSVYKVIRSVNASATRRLRRQ